VSQKELPLPKELWDRIPPDIQAALWVVIEGYEQRIATLEAELVALKTRVNQNSQNSSRPPSSDGPEVKRRPPQEPSGRKRGGQPGHPPHRRVLVPLEQVQVVVPCVPPQCRRCGEPLQGSDPTPLRHQVTEIPVPSPEVTEYQLHRLACPRCGVTTCGSLPPGVPALSYGPRLASLVALCSGAYRMSKRMVTTFCSDVLGVPLAVGEVCPVAEGVTAALEPPVQEARADVRTQHVNGDETTWHEQRQRVYLWVAVTQWVSVFLIRASRGATVLLAGGTGYGRGTGNGAPSSAACPGYGAPCGRLWSRAPGAPVSRRRPRAGRCCGWSPRCGPSCGWRG
jgi:transposase